MRIGYFPKSWKRAVIITIPKPGKDIRHPANYRPISLLSSLSKVFEKVILTKLNAVIGSKIRQEQFAFRSHHSITHQLVGLIDRLSVNKSNKQRTAAIFLDIEKAFDRVWHSGLLYKLHQLNTPAYLLALVKSFLQDRIFIVRVENEISSAKPIRAGVPQGSCLSPILYSAYTNDIPLNSNASLSLFADDTLLTTTNRNPSRAAIQLQKQIDLAMAWFQKWKLKVNAQKSVAVMFNRPRGFNDFKPQINGQTIEWSTSSKYLGLTIDQDQKFKKTYQYHHKESNSN